MLAANPSYPLVSCVGQSEMSAELARMKQQMEAMERNWVQGHADAGALSKHPLHVQALAGQLKIMHLRLETVCLCGGSDAESRGYGRGCSPVVIAFVSVVSALCVALHPPLLMMISSSYLFHMQHTRRVLSPSRSEGNYHSSA